MLKSSAAALCAVLALGASFAAHAQTESVSVKVKTADLNLATNAGAQILAQRIRSAATRACYSDDRLYLGTGYVECINQAQVNAVANLAAPAVIALRGVDAGKAALAHGALVIASAR